MEGHSAGIVMWFNECINRRDLGGLSRLMTGDHVFIDSANNTISGKERCVEAWRGFFAAFPDYRNHFEHVVFSGSKAVIAEWHVYEDTSANRALLGKFAEILAKA